MYVWQKYFTLSPVLQLPLMIFFFLFLFLLQNFELNWGATVPGARAHSFKYAPSMMSNALLSVSGTGQPAQH